MDRQFWQSVFSTMHQFGITHGLLSGLVALIRGAYEQEGLKKALFDALLCVVIASFVMSFPGLEDMLEEHPNRAMIVAMVIGIIGANLIITTIRETFKSALKQLNPLNWFKKGK